MTVFTEILAGGSNNCSWPPWLALCALAHLLSTLFCGFHCRQPLCKAHRRGDLSTLAWDGAFTLVPQVWSIQAGHKFFCSACHRSSTALMRPYRAKQSAGNNDCLQLWVDNCVRSHFYCWWRQALFFSVFFLASNPGPLHHRICDRREEGLVKPPFCFGSLPTVVGKIFHSNYLA